MVIGTYGMASTNTTPPSEWFGLVKEIANRNGVVTIHPEAGDGDNDDLLALEYKVRLLKIDDGQWIVERPFAKAGELGFPDGRGVYGIVHTESHRFGFRSRVAATELFELNDSRRVPVLRLAAPHDVQLVQRRAYYRIPLAAVSLPSVGVWPVRDLSTLREAEYANERLHRLSHSDDPQDAVVARPDVGQPLTARLFDLSGNGMALITDMANRPLFSEVERLWIEFNLPNVEHPIAVVGKVVRVNAFADRELFIGIQFCFDYYKAHQIFVTDHICRYAAQQQRLKLQRQR